MTGKHNVIALCGSTKFREQFMIHQKNMALQGNIVLMPCVFNHDGDSCDAYQLELTEEQKTQLADMERCRIDMCDEIYVINVDGYIGKQTKAAIEYAEKTGKPVNYMIKFVDKYPNRDSMIGRKVKCKDDGSIHVIKDIASRVDKATYELCGQKDNFAVITDDGRSFYENEIEIL